MDRPGDGSHFLMLGVGSEMLTMSHLLPDFDFRDLWEESRVSEFSFAQGRSRCALHPHLFSALQRELLLFHIFFWTSFLFVKSDSF